MRQLLLSCVAIAGICGSLLPAAGDEPIPVFVLHTADGSRPTGPLRSLGPDWSVAVGGLTPAKVPAADVLSLRRAGVPLPAYPTEAQLLLVNGDRLPGQVLEMSDERLRFQAALGSEQELSVPLSAVSVIWLHGYPNADPIDMMRLRRRLLAEKRSRDRILLRNGDALEGTLTAIEREGRVLLETGKREVKVERDQVAAIALSTELARGLRPKGLHARLVLANGGRLVLAAAQADARVLTGKTLFGAAVKVPVEQLAALDLYGGAAVYLSDLKTKGFEYTSPSRTELTWPPVRDGSVAGLDLRLGGSTHDKGLGMHSHSILTYDLAGGYRWFETLVGLDDLTGRPDGDRPGGSVRIRVLLDGKPQDIGWDRELTWRDGPQPIRLRVAGARELSLVVEFGKGSDVQDHVNWADARLIR
jgi:hypothetical protein